MTDVKEKLRKLIAFDFPFETHVESIVNPLRESLASTNEGLTPERASALAEFEENLRSRRALHDEGLMAIYTSLGFDEQDIDALLRLAEKADPFQKAVVQANHNWMQDAFDNSPNFVRINQALAAQWAAINTEGDTSESLRQQAAELK